MNIKVLKKVFTGLVLLFLLSILALYLWFSSDAFYVNTTNRQDASSVGWSFTFGLIENREVKPLVAPELWPRIDEWMITHEEFNCRTNWWSLNDVQGYAVGNNYVHTTHCSEGGSYHFRLEGLVLEKINNEWQVVGWDKICERYPDENECHTVLEQ